MHNTEKSIVLTKSYIFFKNLLALYPNTYRKKFEEEMIITFEDMYHDKVLRDGKTGITFWLQVCIDITINALEQHRQLLKKQGMKKYTQKTLHINKYNIIGSLLLLPFFSVFLIDLFARIAQGDLTHYNRPVYSLLSHSLFYWFPVLFIWVILFPALAVVINLIPLIKNGIKKHGSIFNLPFIRQNVISLALLAVVLGFLAIIKFHDFAPCMFHGLLKLGIAQLSHIFPVCRNA